MNKWDGQAFIDQLDLSTDNDVLEIGVGTGRLALRTAPFCGTFCGIDISSKTIERAKENLSKFDNVTLICSDVLTHRFDRKFDVIYSSLTFMHIVEKQKAIEKAASLMNPNARFVLSIDKNQNRLLDYGSRKITIYPDNPIDITGYMEAAKLKILKQFETELAVIFVAENAGQALYTQLRSR